VSYSRHSRRAGRARADSIRDKKTRVSNQGTHAEVPAVRADTFGRWRNHAEVESYIVLGHVSDG